MQNDKPSKIKIAGIWQQETKNGITYFSGDLSYSSRIEIWPNKKREGKKDPDYMIYIVEKQVKNPAAVKAALDDVKNQQWPDFPHNDIPRFNPTSEVPF